MTPQEALQEAIRIAGGQEKLASKIGRTQSRISQMLKEGRAALSVCADIERATGVTCAQLRPEKFSFQKRNPRRRSK